MSEETLGSYLRGEREKRGITIEQVASSTKISVRLLHALENDQYSDLPAKPFVRGFVASYAKFVGIDHEDILTQYSEFLDENAKSREARRSAPAGFAFEKKDTERGRAILLMATIAFLVIGGSLTFLLRPMFQRKSTSHLEKLREAVKKEKQAAEKVAQAPKPKVETETAAVQKENPAPTETPAAEEPKKEMPAPSSNLSKNLPPAPTGLKSVEPGRVAAQEDPLKKGDLLPAEKIFYKIVLRSKESFWVRYQVDNNPMIQFMLEKDRLLVLRAERGIRVQVSNPSVVQYRHTSGNYRRLEGSEILVPGSPTPSIVIPKPWAAQFAAGDVFPGKPPLPKVAKTENSETQATAASQ